MTNVLDKINETKGRKPCNTAQFFLDAQDDSCLKNSAQLLLKHFTYNFTILQVQQLSYKVRWKLIPFSL